MRLPTAKILVVLLALMVGVALGAGLVGALRTPAPPRGDPIQLEGESSDKPGRDEKNKERGDSKDNGKPPGVNDSPAPQNDPPAGTGGGVAPPPPPPPPPPGDDDDEGGDDTDDEGGGDD